MRGMGEDEGEQRATEEADQMSPDEISRLSSDAFRHGKHNECTGPYRCYYHSMSFYTYE